MKIAINTIMHGANYGNRLQNYALQTILRQEGYSVETLRRSTSQEYKGISQISMQIKNSVKRILGRPYLKKRKLYEERKKRFKNFNTQYIYESDILLKQNQYPYNINEKYDYFICGSDQVWNAKIGIVEEDILNYLDYFATPNKRISYAASFGINEIMPRYEKIYVNELKKFKQISVREENGVSLLRKYGISSSVVLDPTMLLTKEMWKNIAKKPLFMKNSKYILTYFLGGRSDKMEKYLANLAQYLECQVINLENEFQDDENIINKEFYLVDPCEFVWLVQNACCILTDSFHGTVFSILFHKPFSVFERKNVELGNDMNGRIETLLKKFHLENHRKDIENPQGVPQNFDKEKIEHILKITRRDSLDFLHRALK